MTENSIFQRQALLVGDKVLDALKRTRAILFGLGGVGSWCAEALVRSGIGRLTIVDADTVCITNINRQLPATTATLNQPKAEVMLRRLKSINPDCELTALTKAFRYTNAEHFEIHRYDYVLDAIDSLSPKVDLITAALAADVPLFSAMGAACKLDPTRIRTGSFWKVEGCPLASKMRKRLRKRKIKGDFQCVYSDELRLSFNTSDNTEEPQKGSAVHITAPFGFYLSWLLLKDIMEKNGGLPSERGRG